MTREWQAPCKWPGCTNTVGYSDRSYRESLRYGFSRPEYCEKHQDEERKMRKGVATPYFPIPRLVGEIEPGPLGYIKRPEPRSHVATEGEGHFDESQFGVTPDKIYEIAEWFTDQNHRVAIVVGPTGSGKSTAVPYWLVYPPQKVVEDFGEDFFTRDGQILVTLPRIAALKGIARFVGIDLMGATHIGKGYDVGYSYSEDRNTDWRNVLIPQTDGQFINSIISGRISQYGIVVIDEAHERSENIETILRLLRDRMGLYPHLKVIIASATIDKDAFREFFQAQGAKIIPLEGKRVDKHGNPVSYQEYYADASEAIDYEDIGRLKAALPGAIKKKTEWLLNEILAGRKERGDVLIFLHSESIILKVVDQLKAMVNQVDEFAKVVTVYPFYRDLDEDAKERILYQKPKAGQIRIIVSTNYAEASLTINTLVYVIDSGVEIRTEFKAVLGKTDYPVALVSKANARQRWGRVGRTSNGEVYCLYTEDQFERLFRDFPIPALERSNMESLVLKAKAAGIPNVFDGWLGQPSHEEIERATNALISSKLLTEDGQLTTYGLTALGFSYPPRLVDLIMLADEGGCGVEIATLLPFIRNGGERRLLGWNGKWDAYTKRMARRRHLALMAGCQDDVDFILKLNKAWLELPWLDSRRVRGLSEDELDSIRKQWADIHFVNHNVLVKIHNAKGERTKTLERLGVNTKSDVRHISLDLSGRVRTLLRMMLTDAEIVPVSLQYHYVPDIEPQSDSLATCCLISDVLGAAKPEFEIEAPTVEASMDKALSHLFVDQVYPVGYRFAAKALESEQEHTWIQTTRNLTRAQLLTQQTVSLVEEDEELDDESDDVMLQEEPKANVTISLAEIPVHYHAIKCRQAIWGRLPNGTEEFVVEIVDFQFPVNQVPVVITEVVHQPEPFDLFSERHRAGDEIVVEVDDVLRFEIDSSEILVVHDVDTGLEILVEPQDMSFTRSAQAISSIRKGARLGLNIENIDKQAQRVRLSNWEKVEQAISEQLENTTRHDKSVLVTGWVSDIHTDGKVIFVLQWGNPAQGVCVVARGYPNQLPKPPQEFSVGEQVAVRVYRKEDKKYHSDLRVIPEKVKHFVPDIEADGLFRTQRQLWHKGRMRYEELYEFKTISHDLNYQAAVEKLYWLSNQVEVREFTDVASFHQATHDYPIGSFVHGATIIDVQEIGAFVRLGSSDSDKGFVHRRRVLGELNKNTFSTLSVGQQVNVKIVSFNTEYQIPEVEIYGFTTDGDDPLNRVHAGDLYTAEITGIDNEKGFLYLRLENGVEGRVHFKQMYIDTRSLDLEEIYSVGQHIRVKAYSVNRETRLVDFDMRIPDHDPYNVLRVGTKYTGYVARIESYGIFVTLAAGIEGLVHRSEMFLSDEDLTQIFETGQQVVILLKEIKPDRKISLSMKISEYDRTSNWKVGTEVRGTVKDINRYGTFVAIAPGIDGKLLVVPEERTGLFGLGGMKKPKIEIGMTLVVRIISITPNRKNPNKTDYGLEYVRQIK